MQSQWIRSVLAVVLMFGIPAAIVLGLIPGPRTWRLIALGFVWFYLLASQTAYLAHPGVTGFFGVDGMNAVQGHNLVYWLGQPLFAAVLVVIMVQTERLRTRLSRRKGGTQERNAGGTNSTAGTASSR